MCVEMKLHYLCKIPQGRGKKGFLDITPEPLQDLFHLIEGGIASTHSLQGCALGKVDSGEQLHQRLQWVKRTQQADEGHGTGTSVPEQPERSCTVGETPSACSQAPAVAPELRLPQLDCQQRLVLVLLNQLQPS